MVGHIDQVLQRWYSTEGSNTRQQEDRQEVTV